MTVKMWVFVDCPACGFTGCAAPVDDAPCPKCGFRQGTVPQVSAKPRLRLRERMHSARGLV
jgi:ssDNA-binding Zn-finger/Zn-ribbon topoisomerase 1